MPVVKLTLEYDAARYGGWQVQPNGPSIQAEVERALATLHQGPRRVTAAGRTDAGVHARGQVVSFPEQRPLPLAAYVKGANALLPEDVAVVAASIEPDGFDARRSARGKRYRYVIENVEGRRPLGRLQAWMLGAVTQPGSIDDALRSRPARRHLAPDKVESVILPSATLTPKERLDIYHRMYGYRMVGAMSFDYPAVEHFLDHGHSFRAVVLDYVAAFPSKSYTHNQGHGLRCAGGN